MLEDYRANPDGVRRFFDRDRLRWLMKYLPAQLGTLETKFLDLGCSSGVFLAALRDIGYRVAGQDIAPEAVERGKRELHLDMKSQPFEEFTPDPIPDVVTGYNVIEHTPDPLSMVRHVRSWVEPGAAFVLRTPNHASWLRRATGAAWLWYMPPAHLHYFTPASLTVLLEKGGFQVKALRTDIGTYLFLLAYYFLPAKGRKSPSTSLSMSRARERWIFGLEKVVRCCASPLLVPAALLQANPLIEIYAIAR